MTTKGYERAKRNRGLSAAESPGYSFWVSLKRDDWPNGLRLAKWAMSTILITSTVILDFAALHRGYERLRMTTNGHAYALQHFVI